MNFKKIVASIGAVFTMVYSFGSMVNVSATENRYSCLYRCLFYAPANTYLVKVNANTSYNPNQITCYNYGNSCAGENFIDGSFVVNNVEITDTQKCVYINYTNSNPDSQSGYIGFVDFTTKSTIPEFTVTCVQNDRGNNLSLDTVSIFTVMMGDINCDGKVNITDYNLLTKAVVGNYDPSKTGKIAADLNGDGDIDVHDINIMLDYIGGSL